MAMEDTLFLGDYPSETSGFPIATFDYQRVVPYFVLGTCVCCSGRRGFATGDFEKQLMPEAAAESGFMIR